MLARAGRSGSDVFARVLASVVGTLPRLLFELPPASCARVRLYKLSRFCVAHHTARTYVEAVFFVLSFPHLAARVSCLEVPCSATRVTALVISTSAADTGVDDHPSVKDVAPWAWGFLDVMLFYRGYLSPSTYSPGRAVPPGSEGGYGGNVRRRGLRANNDRVCGSSQNHRCFFFDVSRIARLSSRTSGSQTHLEVLVYRVSTVDSTVMGTNSPEHLSSRQAVPPRATTLLCERKEQFLKRCFGAVLCGANLFRVCSAPASSWSSGCTPKTLV